MSSEQQPVAMEQPAGEALPQVEAHVEADVEVEAVAAEVEEEVEEEDVEEGSSDEMSVKMEEIPPSEGSGVAAKEVEARSEQLSSVEEVETQSAENPDELTRDESKQMEAAANDVVGLVVASPEPAQLQPEQQVPAEETVETIKEPARIDAELPDVEDASLIQSAAPTPVPQFDMNPFHVASIGESPLKQSVSSGSNVYESSVGSPLEGPGSPTSDQESGNDTNPELLDVSTESAGNLHVELTSPFSTSVNGPGCSTADDIPESPASILVSPAPDEEYGADFEPSPSATQSPVGPPSPQLEMSSPGFGEPSGESDVLDYSSSYSPRNDSAPPSPELESNPNDASSSVLAPVSPVSVESPSAPSPPSRIVAPKAKKSTASNPPPAPVVTKKDKKPAVTRQTSASRLPASKPPTAVKTATKPSATTKTMKPAIPSSGANASKSEPLKKAMPAKTTATKKRAPKAVVYNISPVSRSKKAISVSHEAATINTDKELEAEKATKSETNGEDAKVHPKKVSKAASEAASNRLYEAAKAAKLRREARSAEVDEACTFAPKVSHSTKRPTTGETDRFAALHEEAKQLQAKKQELQRKHEEETCTFRPAITSKAKHLARDAGRPRYENLYMQARELKQKREEKALAKKEQEKEEYSFRPKIKATKSPVKARPLYDVEREKQKQALREQKKAEAEMTECTFKPKVLSKKPSTKPEAGSSTAEEGQIYDRLYRAGKAKEERIEKMRKEREDEEKAKAPFQPQLVSAATTQKGKDKDKDGEPPQKEPFHKRLYKKDHLQKTTADREQQKIEEERKFSFKPKITEVPEEIKAKQKEYISPDKPIFERLYEEKDKIKEKLLLSEEIRQQNEMAECTFRPRVASTTTSSNGSAPSSPVWERLSICHKNQALEEREKLRQQLEMQECTFKPVISPSDHISPYKSPSYAPRRRSSRGENCSPSFDTATRKISVKPSRSSPDSRSSMPQFQPVSIGNILKSSTLVLSEDSSSPSESVPSNMSKRGSAFGLEESAVLDYTQNSPRRPSPVHKPTEDGISNVIAKKLTSDINPPATSPLPVSRSLDAEFQAVSQ